MKYLDRNTIFFIKSRAIEEQRESRRHAYLARQYMRKLEWFGASKSEISLTIYHQMRAQQHHSFAEQFLIHLLVALEMNRRVPHD